ncbi:MAG: hypothetical protein KGH93_00520 [Patescibacteria group bacterium]|nr:hypothetical protein [Patescibacteria group bacterium]MDE1945674.1 hypothetical protein [Patescibacteria group bacterium]
MENQDMKKKGGSSVFIGLVIGIIIGVGGLWAWNHFNNPSTQDLVSQANQAQVSDLIAKVGKLVILPSDEQPIVATINDAATLVKQQAFYTGAENGDVVIVYQKAAKAIVYSPSRNIIVNVGPVFQQPAAQTSTTTPTKK